METDIVKLKSICIHLAPGSAVVRLPYIVPPHEFNYLNTCGSLVCICPAGS